MDNRRVRFGDLVDAAGVAGRYRRIVLQTLESIVEEKPELAACIDAMTDEQLVSQADTFVDSFSERLKTGPSDPGLREALATALSQHCRATGLDVAHRMVFTRGDLDFLEQFTIRHVATRAGVRDVHADLATVRNELASAARAVADAADTLLTAYTTWQRKHEEIVRDGRTGRLTADDSAELVKLHIDKERARARLLQHLNDL